VEELLEKCREFGVAVPVYQVSPVLSAKTGTVKSFGDHVQVLPVQQPSGLGLGMLRALFASDLDKALQLLLSMAVRELNHKSSVALAR
jgi:hypothetical protein